MDLISILRKLVSFDVFGGESNIQLVHWIKDYMKEQGLEAHLLYDSSKEKALLHCRIGPAVDGGVVLSGHMDVVPVEGQDWDTDPFVLTEKNGKLYGRGSCDMKGFLACCMSLIPDMLQADLKKPIYFAFSYDEEIGCRAGDLIAQTLNEFYPEQIAYAIIGEPTLMLPTIGQKGICFYKTEVNGSQGHSSRILQEVSAVHESMRLINWLEQKMLQLSVSSVDARFEPPHTSIHVGKIQGGIATNIIADQCSFDWDVRTIPSDDLVQIMDTFKQYCAQRMEELSNRFPEFHIRTIEAHPPVPALDTRTDSGVLKLLRAIGINGEEQAVSYAAEAGQFARNGFDSIICGPGSIEQAHRANEFIEIEQLNHGQQMIRNLIYVFGDN